MNARTRRLLLLVLGVVLAWYVATLFWAARPLHDTVPIGNQPGWQEIKRDEAAPAPQPIGDHVVANQRITCKAVLHSGDVDGALPTLAFPQQFNREPCALAHSNGRTILVLDTLAAVAAFALVGFVLLRDRRTSRRSAARPIDDLDRLVSAQH